MNEIHKARHYIFKRSVALLLVTCLIVSLVPPNFINKISKAAASNTLEDPLKNYVFDESNTVTLNLLDGNYIYIYEDGYVQSTTADTTKTNLVAHTGNYTIKGTSGSDVSINVVSGNSDIRLQKLTCSSDLSVVAAVDVNLVIDTFVKTNNLRIISSTKKSNIGIKGVNGAIADAKWDLYVGYYSSGVLDSEFASIAISDLTFYGRCTFASSGDVNIFSSNYSIGTGYSTSYTYLNIYNKGNVNISDFTGKRVDSVNAPISMSIYSDKKVTLNNIFLDNSGISTGGNLNIYSFTSGIKNEVNTSNVLALGFYTNVNIYSQKFQSNNSVFIRTKDTKTDSTAYYQLVDTQNARQYTNTSFIFNTTSALNSKNAKISLLINSGSAIFDKVSYGGSATTGEVIPYNFTSSQTFLNTDGDELFPSILHLSEYRNQYATVKVDNWDSPARLYLDQNGYLFPWLTEGEHEVEITLEDGSEASFNVTPSKEFTPEVKEVVPSIINRQTINLDLPSTDIKYSYDKTSWSNATTDGEGKFTVEVQSGKTDFYVKTIAIPVISFHAAISDDTIGTIKRLQPSIASQSNSIMIKRNSTATLYVAASPSSEENSISYEWYRDTEKLDSSTNVCEVLATDDNDFNTYYCKIIETNGSIITSDPITIIEDTSLSGLESELYALKEKQQELQNELDKTKSQSEQLENELSTSTDENNSLKKEIEQLKQEILRLNELVNNYVSRINDLENEVERLEQELANKETTLAEKESEIEGYKNSIKNLSDELNNTLNENTSLRQLIDSIKAELGISADTEIITAIRNLKNRVTSLESEKAILQTLLDSANDKITELESTVSSVTNENSYLKEQIESLKSEKQSLQDQISDLTNTNNELLNKISNLEENNRNANTTIDTLRSQINDLEIEVTNYETTIVNLRNTVNTYNELLVQIRTALNVTSNDDILAAIAALKSRITTLESTNADLQNALDTANARIIALEEIIKTNTNVSDELKNQIKDLEEEKETLTTQITTLTETINELNTRIAELETSLNDANTTITELRQTILELNLTISEQSTKILDMQNKITSLETLMEQVKTALGVTSNNDILPAIAQLKASLADLSESVRTLTDEQQKLNDKLAKEQAAKDALNDFINEIRKLVDVDTNVEIEQKIRDYQNQLTEKDVLINRLTEESAKKDETINSLKEQIKELQKQIETLTLALDSDNNELINRINELNAEIETLKNTISTLKGEIESYKNSINNLTNEVNDLKAEILRIKYELESANKTIEELRSECVEANTQNELLKDELAAAQEKIAQLEKEKADLTVNNKTITTLEDENKKLKEEIERLKVQTTPSTPVQTTTEIEKEAIIVTPAADTTSMITTTDTKIEATKGWEVSTGLTDSWSDSLNTTELFETNSLFTFFTGTDLASAKSLKTEKRIIYTRKKDNPDKVYICNVGVTRGESDYQAPSFSITSNINGVDLVSTESNKTQVAVTKKVKINVDADCGTVGLKGIYYKVVAYDNDFDPDGSWTPINKSSFTYKVTEPVRIYIKVEDNSGNYTVSKTVVVKPYQEPPTFNLNKVIYLDSSYTLKLDTDKDTTVTYSSADNKIATVSSKGKIKAQKIGKTVISVVVKDKLTKEIVSNYKIHVTCKKSDDSLFNYSLKDNNIQTSLDDTSLLQQYKVIKVGHSTKIKISAADDASVVYISTDKDIATVSKNGVVKGKKKGSTNVLVSVVVDGKSYVYAIKIRVSDGTKDTDKDRYLK